MSESADAVDVEWVRSLKQRHPYFTDRDIATLTGHELGDVRAALKEVPQPDVTIPIYRMREVAG